MFFQNFKTDLCCSNLQNYTLFEKDMHTTNCLYKRAHKEFRYLTGLWVGLLKNRFYFRYKRKTTKCTKDEENNMNFSGVQKQHAHRKRYNFGILFTRSY